MARRLGFHWALLAAVAWLACGQGSHAATENSAPPRRHADGSCRAAGLCCPGRDAACVVRKAMLPGVGGGPNAVVEERDEQSCYCDHACLRLGDCCDDFKESCGGERPPQRMAFSNSAGWFALRPHSCGLLV